VEFRLSPPAQAGIGLEFLDHRHEIIDADNAFELETRTVLGGPDAMSLDSANDRKADDGPIAPRQLWKWNLSRSIDHKAMGGKVADVQLDIAARSMLRDHRTIDRMPRRAAQVGNRQLSAVCHRTFLLFANPCEVTSQ
jgi:hypothetical protein